MTTATDLDPDPCAPSAGQQRAAFALQSIQRSLTHGVDVDRIADRLHVSRRQLERDFRRWQGAGMMAYARRRRFELAAEALGRGDPIVQVAMDCGYADQSHLTNTVRKMTGQTPRALRHAARDAFDQRREQHVLQA